MMVSTVAKRSHFIYVSIAVAKDHHIIVSAVTKGSHNIYVSIAVAKGLPYHSISCS